MQLLIAVPIINFKLEEQVDLTLDNFIITDSSDEKNKILASKNFNYHFGLIGTFSIISNHLLIFRGDPKSVRMFNNCNSLAEVGQIIFNSLASNLFNNLWFIKDNSVYVKECFLEQYEGEPGTESFRSLNCQGFTLARHNSNYCGDFGVTTVSIREMQRLIDIDRKIKTSISIDPLYKKMIPGITDRQTRIITDESNYIPYNFNRFIRALMILAKVQSEARVILKIAFQMSLCESLFTIGREALTEQVTEKPALFIGGNEKELASNIAFFKRAYDIRSKFFHGDRITNSPTVLAEMNRRLDECTRIIFNKVLADLTIFTFSDSKTDKKRFRQFWQNLAVSHSRLPTWDLKQE